MRKNNAAFEETNPHQQSSMAPTSSSTASSAYQYSDEDLEEEFENEILGTNMTDLDVRKETEAFLLDNKLRLENIRFNSSIRIFL